MGEITPMVRQIMEDLSLTAADMAAAMDVTKRTVALWLLVENCQVPRSATRKSLQRLDAIRLRLVALFPNEEERKKFLHTKHPIFLGTYPVTIIRFGRFAKFEEMLSAWEAHNSPAQKEDGK